MKTANTFAIFTLVALPFAASAEVTLYGLAHVSLDNLNDGNGSGEFFSSNSSRLGVKASQLLGNGITGLAQYETGVDLSNSSATWGAKRDSFAGLKGGFGTLLGGILPVANQWIYDTNYFPDQQGDAGNFTSNGAPGRADHSLYYLLPMPKEFSLGITYVPKQSTSSGNTVLGTMGGVKGGFNQGPMTANAGYFDLAQLGKIVALSGRYNFGAGSVAAIVINRDTSSSGQFSGVTAAKGKVLVASVGADYKIGSGTIKSQLSRASDSASGAKDGATMLAFGYDYKLADNATAYVTYASVSNDTNGTRTPSDWGHGSNVNVAPGNDPSGISFGFLIGL